MRGKVIEDDSVVNIINTYAPQDKASKKLLWSQLSNLISSHNNEAFCLMGDFNYVRKDKERNNCIYRQSDSEDFNKFIKKRESLGDPSVGIPVYLVWSKWERE